MSQVNGQLTTCARCGEQIFRRCTEECEADGGFTRWNTFEPYPEGWGIVDVPPGSVPGPYNCVRVCPACHKVWDEALVAHFIRGTRLEVVKEEAPDGKN